MNIVIFAGGVGTRLWPLSRKKSPKQFEAIIGEKSTLQLCIDRLVDVFDPKSIYISTNKQYKTIVSSQLPFIPAQNIILEPVLRDVGPAVGLLTAILSKIDPHTPMAILWSDHLVNNIKLFQTVLSDAEKYIQKHPQKMIFISQKPRFPNQNLGWIEYGSKAAEVNSNSFYTFCGFKYQPDIETAKEYFKSKKYAWNLGYFITTPSYLMEKFKKFTPDIYKKLLALQNSWGSDAWDTTLEKIYPTFEKISFDNAILEKLSHDELLVAVQDLQWSDIGAWDALKEALQKNEHDNVIKGNVLLEDSSDTLIYNYNDKQLLVGIDLKGMLVITTDDVIIICKKDSIPKVKNLVKGFEGTKHEHLT